MWLSLTIAHGSGRQQELPLCPPYFHTPSVPVCDNVKTFMCRSICLRCGCCCCCRYRPHCCRCCCHLISLREGNVFNIVCLSVCSQWRILMWSLPTWGWPQPSSPRPIPSCSPVTQTSICKRVVGLWLKDLVVVVVGGLIFLLVNLIDVTFIKLHSFAV